MGDRMLAARFYGKGDIRVEEVPKPKIGEGDVLVRVGACGICGSDYRLFDRGPVSAKMDPWPIPRILGHEFVGHVAELGREVRGYELGDRVAAAPATYCGECFYCRKGDHTLCLSPIDFGSTHPGGFAEFVLIPALMVRQRGLVRLEEGIPLERGIFVEPLGTCVRGLLTKGQLKPGERVAVVGDGPIGLIQVCLASHLGAGWILSMGHHASKLRRSGELGSHKTVNTAQVGVEEIVTGELDGYGVDLVVVSAPTVSAIEEGLQLVRDGGRIVLFGGVPRQAHLRLHPNAVHYGEITIIGSYNCTAGEARKAADLLKDLPLEELITARYPLPEAPQAFEAIASTEGLKTMIVAADEEIHWATRGS